jgi:hypothetical protein
MDFQEILYDADTTPDAFDVSNERVAIKRTASISSSW